jgi:alpha-L-fucosidase
MFVHWDHASQQGLEISWPLAGGNFALPHCPAVSVEQYHSSASTFDPKEWDPEALARLARRAGMRYAVFTTKHHNGFAMFHSERSSFSIRQSPFGADIVRQFADAMRAAGLRLGFYFSLSDWSHADYPPLTDDMRPYVPTLTPPLPEPRRWQRFVDDMFAQVRELLTHYGRVDLLWFDGGWERTAEQWQGAELESMIRSLQPEILINDRLPGIVADFETPEQFIPPKPPAGLWETCMTMNESWGYNPQDREYKSARELIHTLCEVAGRGGNLLLNVSPTGTGALPPVQEERLEAVAAWMSRHAVSVTDTEPGLEPWQFYGPSTRRGERLYLHLLSRPYDSVRVRGVPVRRLQSAHCLGSGTRLEFSTRTAILDGLTEDPRGEVQITVPEETLDEHATVLVLDFVPESGGRVAAQRKTGGA